MSRGRRRIPGITVYQLKSAWSYRITGEPETVSGRRIRPYKGGFATEEEAWRAAVDAKKRLESGRTPHAKNMQVGEYFQEWLKTVKSNLKETTAQSYSDMIKAYVNPSMGSRRLGDLKVPTLNAFYRDLRDFGRRNGQQLAYVLVLVGAPVRPRRIRSEATRHGSRLRDDVGRRPRSGTSLPLRTSAE